MCVHVKGGRENGTLLDEDSRSFCSPTPNSGSVRKTIFSFFCYRSMLHMYCLPSPLTCVHVCIHAHRLTSIGFCACI